MAIQEEKGSPEAEEEDIVPQNTYIRLASALKRSGYHAVVSDGRLNVEGFSFVLKNSVDRIEYFEDMVFLPAAESRETLKGMVIGIMTPRSSSEVKIVNFVRKLGIRSKLKGYQYLITGISLAVQDPSLLKNVIGVLYPNIANIYGVKVHSVERGIRRALSSAYHNDPDVYRRALYDQNAKPYELAAKPTASVVLACAVKMIPNQ